MCIILIVTKQIIKKTMNCSFCKKVINFNEMGELSKKEWNMSAGCASCQNKTFIGVWCNVCGYILPSQLNDREHCPFNEKHLLEEVFKCAKCNQILHKQMEGYTDRCAVYDSDEDSDEENPKHLC